jgi:MoaA/NifB/PqqE/SkfB family radical SAM enzyme
MYMSLLSLPATVHSQARIALLNRNLWSRQHLLGALSLSAKWFIQPDGTAPSPMAMAWYMTHACPESCNFCNVSRALEVETPSLALKEARTLIDKLVPQIPVVALGGGEPMAHPNILEIIHHIHKRKGRLFVVTSGTTIGPNKAKALCAENPEMIMISLLGDEPTHNERMGREGAYQRTLSAIENIQKYRKPNRTRLILNCTISPSQIEIIDSVVAIAKSLKVDALRFSWLSFMSEKEFSLSPKPEPYFIMPDEEIRQFDWKSMWKEVIQIQKNNSGFVQFLPRLNEDDFREWFAGSGVKRACLSLWHTLFVRPDGTVVPCGHMQDKPIGHTLDQSLEQYWNSEQFRTLRLKQRHTPFQMCGRCCKI